MSSEQLVTAIRGDPEMVHRSERHKIVTIDGVTYMITAQHLAGRWFGQWACNTCDVCGANGPLEKTMQEAFVFAEQALMHHHHQMHLCPIGSG